MPPITSNIHASGASSVEEFIDQIHEIRATGAEIEDEMQNWGHGVENDLQREANLKNRIVSVRSIVRDVMTRDEMFVLDPLDPDFDFLVKMSAFFYLPPSSRRHHRWTYQRSLHHGPRYR
jgi:hypothetical protein